MHPVRATRQCSRIAERQDGIATAWWSHNGERIGTYTGHNGAVWSCDVNCEFPLPSLLMPCCLAATLCSGPSRLPECAGDTTIFATSSADNTAMLWNAETGERLNTLPHKVRRSSPRPFQHPVVADEKPMPDLHEGSTKPKTLILRQLPWRFVLRLVLRCGFLCIF
jgi:hypothetical protein